MRLRPPRAHAGRTDLACATVLVLAGTLVGTADAVAQANPRIFAPDTISDHRWQWRITFTPSGDTAYYAVSDGFFPAARVATIVMSARTADGWSHPVVAPFSGNHQDMDPFVTRDGTRLYFSSSRPTPADSAEERSDFDIWYVDRTDNGWGTPVHAGPAVNSPMDELYPSAAGDTLYFAAGPPAPGSTESWDIYHADLTAGSPRDTVPRINSRSTPDAANPTAGWDFNPEVSADGQVLIFTSHRPGGYGSGDLWVSRREGEGWSEPVNLGPCINTPDDEYHPTLTAGEHLYFVRAILTPEVVPGDFYRVDLRIPRGSGSWDPRGCP